MQALLHTAFAPLLEAAGQPVPEVDDFPLDLPRDPAHGDYACTLALTLAKPLGRKPRDIAESALSAIPADPRLQTAEIAGAGFINLRLAPAAFHQALGEILARGSDFGRATANSRGKLLLEFVSANPTGPMHVGHGRGAAYGDALGRVLAAAGWKIQREYYINDAGRQADLLTLSVWLRYLQAGGVKLPFPAACYPGDYVGTVATELRALVGNRLMAPAPELLADLPPDESEGGDKQVFADAWLPRMREHLGDEYDWVRRLALDAQLDDIRDTLDAFGVGFDRWSSERMLVESGAVGKALQRLIDAGLTYERDGALWLGTSLYGDEKDRVLCKSDGSATYFCNDLAYHLDKLGRVGEDGRLLDVWGADHHGYIARMRGALQALTQKTDVLDVQLVQFVTLSSGRMGKRSGNFVTLRELVDEVGRDATRFIYLTRSHDQHLEFDIELARQASNDNPVYYVQYAHARICSLLRQAGERGYQVGEATAADLTPLNEPTEHALIAVLARLPEVVQAAAVQRAPHLVTFYLRDVADAFHRNYNSVPVLVDDQARRDARLALAQGARQVLANGLGLLGVSAPEQM
jgi:arginyl-tRNA synthetase (EC 6.1.1.19)